MNGYQAVGGTVVIAKGCVTPGDAGGGLFYWSTTRLCDDGGTVIVPYTNPTNGNWVRFRRGVLETQPAMAITTAINVVEFGAIGDGETDNIHAFRIAHQALPPDGGTIIIPVGHYRLSGTWEITKPVVLLGAGTPIPRANNLGSWLHFAAGITGIKLPSSSTSEHASTSQISNLYVSSEKGGTPGTGDGIVIGVHGVIIRNCAFAYFGGDGIRVGDGTLTNNANGTVIEGTRSEFNGGNGLHIVSTFGGSGVCTFIGVDCTGNKQWGFRNGEPEGQGPAKNTFITPHAASNFVGDYYEQGSSTAYINCYSEGAGRFEVPDGVVGLFCIAGDYGAPTFTGGPSALNSSANIIIARARGYPTRLDVFRTLTIGRAGSSGALELIGDSAAGGSLSDWFLQGSGSPDRAIQIFNQQSFRAGLYITGGSDPNTSDRVGIGSTTPQAKLHVRPHQTTLDALRVEDSSGNVQFRAGAGVGFYGTAPVAKPTVTGSRGGNAALGSLVSALATLGLITDNTTP